MTNYDEMDEAQLLAVLEDLDRERLSVRERAREVKQALAKRAARPKAAQAQQAKAGVATAKAAGVK